VEAPTLDARGGGLITLPTDLQGELRGWIKKKLGGGGGGSQHLRPARQPEGEILKISSSTASAVKGETKKRNGREM